MTQLVWCYSGTYRVLAVPQSGGLGLVTEDLGRELDFGGDLQRSDLNEADTREGICICPDWAAAVPCRTYASASLNQGLRGSGRDGPQNLRYTDLPLRPVSV